MPAQVSGEPDLVQVDAGRARLAVRRLGSGGTPSVVCLHAGVTDSRSWIGVMEALASGADPVPGMDVVAYDRRGFGATTFSPEAHDQVADLLAVLGALGLGRAVLVGNSRGGQIALDFTLVYPERVAALVLIAPGVSGAPPVQDSDLRPDEATFWAGLEAAEAAEDLDALNRGEMRLWLDGLAAPEGRVNGELRSLALEMNRIALAAESPGYEPAVIDAWDRLAEVRCPVLVVVGDLDTSYLQRRCRDLAAAIPRAELAVMTGAAHLPAFEQPEISPTCCAASSPAITVGERATHVAGRPDPRLRALVTRDYVGFEETAPPGSWLMPPSASITVILNAASAFGGLPDAFAAGLEDRGTVVRRGGVMACVDIKLTPPGAYAVLGTRLDVLSREVVDVEHLFGRPGAELIERVRAARSWVSRFDLVNDFLVRRAEVGHAPRPEVVWAWHRLRATAGRLPIAALAREVGWSQRHLIAKCKEQIGLSPKTVARMLRFEHLLRDLDTGGSVDWSRLAADHGYSDQSHLNRDFRQFVDATPTGYLATRSSDGSVICDEVAALGAGPRVNFVQDVLERAP